MKMFSLFRAGICASLIISFAPTPVFARHFGQAIHNTCENSFFFTPRFPHCGKGYLPVCTKSRPCRTSSGEASSVCMRWGCIRAYWDRVRPPLHR